MKIEKLDIKNIKPCENNAKEHPQSQIDKIKMSIQAFGFNDPIAVDENGVILTGHGRFLAAKQLGLEEVPGVVIKHLNETQKIEYSIIHNKASLSSGFNLELLEVQLKKLKEDGGDLSLTGLEEEELSILKEPELVEIKTIETSEAVEDTHKRINVSLETEIIGSLKLMEGKNNSEKVNYILKEFFK